MGWDGAGGYTRQHNFSADASAGIKILAARMDAELDDVASAMTLAWARNGQNVPTQAIPMGGQRFINVGAATSVGNYMRVREFIENIPVFMQDVESSADRISVSAQYFTSVSANQSPGDGTRIIVRANSNKSSAVLYLNGNSANVEYQAGNRIGAALVSGGIYEFLYSSADTAWKLQNPDDGRTAAEKAAGITPTNYQYGPGDVRRYGAVGDGATDDGAAVNTAVLQSFETGGGKPFGQPGATYLATTWSEIDTDSPLRMQDGFGVVLKGPSTYDDFARPGATVLLEGLTFDHWASVLEQQTADGGSIARLRLFENRAEDTSSITFNFEVPVINYWVRGNSFENVTQLAIRVGENTYANQDTWRKGHILHNNILDVNSAASGDTGGMLVYGKETDIIGNNIEDVDGGATGEAYGIYTKCRYGTVAFNVIRDVLAQTGSAWGINLKGQARSETTSPQGFASRVIGNHVENVRGTAGTGYGIRLQTDTALALGNTVEDCGSTGIALDYSEDVTGLYSAQALGNLIRFTDFGTTVGVRVATSVSHADASHNLIENAFIGVRVAAINGSEVGYAVKNNLISTDAATGFGILVRRDEDLSGLLIAGNQVTAGTLGVRFETGSGVLSNVRLLDNDFQDTTTQISGTLPGDCEIRQSWRFQTTAADPTTAIALTLGDEASYAVELRAVATLDDGAEQNMYHREALFFRNGGGGATIVGTVQDIGTPQEITAAWDATLDASGDTVRVLLTGEASHTINWKLWIHVLGVSAA